MSTFEALMAARAVEIAFQPIVELCSREAAAFEALVRGPSPGPLATPGDLFAAARERGRVAELDRLCRERAVETALAAGLTGPFGLFVNVEPSALEGPVPAPEQLEALRGSGVRLVVEFTERALTADPARLLALADRARAEGWWVALDDVGAHPASLALMPFLRPDVIKLDLRLVQERPDETVAEIMTAVTAHAEAYGAYVVAEGVETEEHEQAARSLGATHAQGWFYGRPGPLRKRPLSAVPARPLELHRPLEFSVESSPYRAVTRLRAPQRGSRPLLAQVSKLIERQARQLGSSAVVLSTFEKGRRFTPAAARRYTELVESAAFVVVFADGIEAEPIPGLRGADLVADDPVAGEWDLAVVGPHFAVALVACDLTGDLDDHDRPFDYVLTYNRAIVLDVARSLMNRVLPTGTETTAEMSEQVAEVEETVQA